MSDLHCRWMIRRDMAEILEIERLVFPFAWSEDEFIRCLRQRNCIGVVADLDDQVVGYMIYELHKNRFHVLNFAVAPRMQRKGVGIALFKNIAKKLTPERRSRILLEIREGNVDAQLFFRAMGFRAVSVLRDYYDDTTEDAYVFQFRVKAEQPANCEGK